MLVSDTREPMDVEAQAGSRLPKGELRQLSTLPCGDYLLTTVNVLLPMRVADFFGWVEKSGFTLPDDFDAEQMAAAPKQKAVELLLPSAMLVERKTGTDFLKSIADGRLFSQVEEMTRQAKFAVVIITDILECFGNGAENVVVDQQVTGWDWWAVQMAIFRVQMAGAAVLMVKSNQFPDALRLLLEWLHDTKTFARRVTPAAIIPLGPEAEFLCGLPGIGIDKAQKVLSYSGNLKHALHFLTNPLSATLQGRPEGIGLKTIDNVREFLELDEGEIVMAVYDG